MYWVCTILKPMLQPNCDHESAGFNLTGVSMALWSSSMYDCDCSTDYKSLAAMVDTVEGIFLNNAKIL